MRQRQEWRGNGSCDQSATGVDLDTAALRCDIRIVQEHLCAGNETGPENLYAAQIACGSKRSVRNRSIGNTSDYARARIRTWNNHLGYFRWLLGVRRNCMQIDNLNSTGARLHHECLVCREINGDTSPQPERTRGAILN